MTRKIIGTTRCVPPPVLNAPQPGCFKSPPLQDEFDVSAVGNAASAGNADGKPLQIWSNAASSDDIRDALRLQKIDNGSPSPQSSSSSSPAQTPPAPQTPEDVLNSFTRPADPATRTPPATQTGTGDEFDAMDRRTLQGLAKDGKLSQYGVKGNSSSDAIRNALRKQKRDNAAQRSTCISTRTSTRASTRTSTRVNTRTNTGYTGSRR